MKSIVIVVAVSASHCVLAAVAAATTAASIEGGFSMSYNNVFTYDVCDREGNQMKKGEERKRL